MGDRQANNGLSIFAGSASVAFTDEICRCLKVQRGACEAVTFSEGNVFVRVQENVRGHDVYIVQTLSYPVNDNFMELLFWIDAFKRASAAQVTAVIPFFSYAKGDKKDEPRVSIRARVCADALESAGADRILTMDLHSPQIQGFFRIPVDHLYARPVICDHYKAKHLDDAVVVSTDVGFGKPARNYARQLGAAVAIGDKERASHDERAAVLDIIGDVEGKTAIIVDDFTISGGSIVTAAEVLHTRGARRILAAVTHAVLAKGAAARIEQSPIEEMIVTDTISYRFEPLPSNVRIISVAPLFAKGIWSIHNRTSISSLFPKP